ncbi:MAG: hypothetical protein LBU32_16205 [Clostridiales bacterium]|jgi:cell division protein FtsL|nr:hypothetical protein [Clostridiales bacterium]
MSSYWKNYGNTTEAFELMPEEKKLRKIRHHRVLKKATKPKASAQRRAGQLQRISFRTIFTLVIIFAGALCVSVSLASVAVSSNKILQLKNSISSQKEINSELAKQLAYDSDINDVMAKAKELGMSEPKPYQSFHVTVPSGSYAVSSEDSSQPGEAEAKANTQASTGKNN